MVAFFEQVDISYELVKLIGLRLLELGSQDPLDPALVFEGIRLQTCCGGIQ